MTESALDTDEQLSGRAADAVADMRDELQRRSSGLNAAEAQLAEALLTAQATSEEGRRRLQDIQRQLIEAINNPVNALDTPAGERQFLMFLRGKIAEIQGVVDGGALTSQDQAELARRLANGYLSDDPRPLAAPLEAAAPRAEQPASAGPATPMASMPAVGGLPQTAAAPAQSLPTGLGAPASPLAGLASLLAGNERDSEAQPDTASETAERGKVTTEDDAEDDNRDSADADDEPASPDDAPPEDTGPAETRPAAS